MLVVVVVVESIDTKRRVFWTKAIERNFKDRVGLLTYLREVCEFDAEDCKFNLPIDDYKNKKSKLSIEHKFVGTESSVTSSINVGDAHKKQIKLSQFKKECLADTKKSLEIKFWEIDDKIAISCIAKKFFDDDEPATNEFIDEEVGALSTIRNAFYWSNVLAEDFCFSFNETTQFQPIFKLFLDGLLGHLKECKPATDLCAQDFNSCKLSADISYEGNIDGCVVKGFIDIGIEPCSDVEIVIENVQVIAELKNPFDSLKNISEQCRDQLLGESYVVSKMSNKTVVKGFLTDLFILMVMLYYEDEDNRICLVSHRVVDAKLYVIRLLLLLCDWESSAVKSLTETSKAITVEEEGRGKEGNADVTKDSSNVNKLAESTLNMNLISNNNNNNNNKETVNKFPFLMDSVKISNITSLNRLSDSKDIKCEHIRRPIAYLSESALNKRDEMMRDAEFDGKHMCI